MKLYLTGFVQVFFVAINTIFLSKEMIIAVFISSFMISIIWSYNVKKIAFGEWSDRLFYSFGAASGGVTALLLSKIITSTIQ